MTYLSLFFAFLKIGCFAFGGAYGAIPLIQETVLAHGWMDEAMLSNIIAVSESTPGPIMVNTATYIGSQQAGVLGAAAATLGVVMPSFTIILLIASVFGSLVKNKTVQAVLKGIKPCLMGIILATGIVMMVNLLFPGEEKAAVDFTAFLIFVFLATAVWSVRRVQKKELSPILLIIFAGLLGGVLY